MTTLVPTVRILIRGATVHASAVFTDRFGAPARPPDVTISFNFNASGGRTTVTADMVFDLNVGTFDYDWDSSIATGPGEVYWAVKSGVSEIPAYAGQGSFSLQANAANLAT